MAIDGSFSLESELKRFLARCPKLQSAPHFSSLAGLGERLTEEEVVNSVAELFLHPDYTVPLVGCFRPIAHKIVDKAVALLRVVPSLRFNPEDFKEEKYWTEDFNAEVVNVIEFYAGKGRRLDLHELACLAFCRALDLAPLLIRSVLSYFKFAPPPFERIRNSGPVTGFLAQASTHLLTVVRSSYRLLLVDTEVFLKLWDWSCFLDLVQCTSNIHTKENDEHSKNMLEMRWCSVQIISVILGLSEAATKNFHLDSEENFECLLHWEEFCQDVALEKAGWYFEFSQKEIPSINGNFYSNCGNTLHSSLCVSSSHIGQIEPPFKSRRLLTWDIKSAGVSFVLTSNIKKCFEMAQLAVSQKWPVLLYGAAGAGKTALINKLARDSGRQVLSIHMDDQIDGKTLVGGHVCTEIPGKFRWQPGSLTLAIQNGLWIVFEDIDNAPSDVQSILLPLLEGAGSFVIGHGEAITVTEDFRLFATISSSKIDSFRNRGGNSLGSLWRSVMVPLPSNEDLKAIVQAWHPNLEPIVEKLIGTFKQVNSVSLHKQAGSLYGKYDSLSFPSRFSLRDLLKWCKRITVLGFNFMEDSLSPYICSCIHQEAVDVFAAHLTSFENRLNILKEISTVWPVCIPLSESLYPPNKPLVQAAPLDLRIGRIVLERIQTSFQVPKKPFVEIRSSLHVLERIACSVKQNEPVLLVGETGTGKTTLVQNLAMRIGQKLTVLNLSQQSDAADLLGGFKPMEARFICIPLYNDFQDLFSRTFSTEANEAFLERLQKHMRNKDWESLLKGLEIGVNRALIKCRSGRKRKKPEELMKAWENISVKLETTRGQNFASSGMVFSFVEGGFVTALKRGDWILLDEVNLSPPETLQRIVGVLEAGTGSLCLAERGDVEYIHRHPNFRLFACMNPATDAGKRDLPYSLRSRFTEYFVDDVLDDEDLSLFVKQFIDGSNGGLANMIVQFYKAAKKSSEERLQDGANQKPQYSLRSLYRAIEYTNFAYQKADKKFEFQKALYDGFCMFFQTLLDGPSANLMNSMILKYLCREKRPQDVPFCDYLTPREKRHQHEEIFHVDFLRSYILTKTVKEHLKCLARAILVKRYPVLLQGPTSSGKTSLVQYLAAITGHEFVRINNHEHTDLQEYLGSYITDASGKLVFHEGVLVKAVRNGYWIVLDELNLAPSDVLEALNRLLDDNRELFVPELCELVQAHPNFMLFATQNPPTFYGGRKMLSRAFRNRFVEIHVDEIPEDELCTILEQRCEIPGSYAKKMVEVMKDLQSHRQRSKVFAGKHGFITARDLFRWANRYKKFDCSYEYLARDGYFLLAERLRDVREKIIVQEVLEKHLVKLGKDDFYKQAPKYAPVHCSIIWTKSMQRLYYLVERCYKLREPVLLVGETGGGKTTVCQVLSMMLGFKLQILNCHQYTETSDFLGGFYPVRDRSQLTSEFKSLTEQLVLSKAFSHFPKDVIISSDIGQASLVIHQLSEIINSYRQGLVSCTDVNVDDIDALEKVKLDLVLLNKKWKAIFIWQDGPLVQAMRDGDLFLVDEISLADDSVLERLNSVLEPERKLSLAEKGGPDLEKIVAHPNFFLLATMNPGGDYGKKELSPALRNRFTEIWVPSIDDLHELRTIARERFSCPELHCVMDPMLNFWEWFNQLQVGRVLTVRDLLSWIDFINVTWKSLQPKYALLHGIFLVLLDGLTLGTGISKRDARVLQETCFNFLIEQLKDADDNRVSELEMFKMESYGWGELALTSDISCSGDLKHERLFGIHPFYVENGDDNCEIQGFEFLAPTTRRNALRVLRALQLPKPVLLEGSPGVGKTSLIVAIGKFSGHSVVRINLSEQTDIMDLLGSDLPVESDDGLKFSWSDGILLQALKQGCWVLLDELNLAPQSVLEGLNAILDHRAEVFIPELNRTFKCPPSFRVFACQNPSYQGGGRKGLPRSFLNRFTKVYVDELVEHDYLYICCSLYPSIPNTLLSNLILFNKRLHEDTMSRLKFAQDGSPWEFNLRDVLRSCQLIHDAPEKLKDCSFLNTVYVQRMRTEADRREVLQLFEQIFGVKPSLNPFPRVRLNPYYLIIGNTSIKRACHQSHSMSINQLKILPRIRLSLESAAQCVQFQWLSILVGPSGSGKTSLIRLLSQLSGNVLNELNLSSSSDISEILGCFEQFNAFCSFCAVVSQVEQYVNELCHFQLESSMEAFLTEKRYLVGKWLSFRSSTDRVTVSSSATAFVENQKTVLNLLRLLAEIIEQLLVDLNNNMLPISWSCNALNRTLKMVLKLQEDYHRRHSARFEWVAGILIKAIENGEWIVLENANICNPTVLDRINSLVEPSGSILINECGIVDGEPMVLHPHPNFRMFLTVNPNYGEVSRAMRNRGVEIFMMPPYWLLERGNDESHKRAELEDVKRFLVLSGIPSGMLVDSMATAHIYAKDEGLSLKVYITYLELSRWVQLFQQLLVNGNQPLWSLHISWEHTYISSFGEGESYDIITRIRDSCLSLGQFCEFDRPLHCSLCLPGGWPMPSKLRETVCYSREAFVKQSCMYVQFLGAQCAAYEFSSSCDLSSTNQYLSGKVDKWTYLVDSRMLHHIMYPNVSERLISSDTMSANFNLEKANKMLFFAFTWIIEQATSETDIKLYLRWFKWMNSQLQPFHQFFGSIVEQLEQELQHSIWSFIFQCHRDLVSPNQVDSYPIPMLSFELVDAAVSVEIKKLSNAIKCRDVLRHSFQQWNAESCLEYNDKNQGFTSVLTSLRVLEEEVLNMLVDSSSFDVLLPLYNSLLQDHMLFWSNYYSDKFDYFGHLSWRSLMKNAAKFLDFCPSAAQTLLEEGKKFGQIMSWALNSQKSMLWVHGGHPFLPPSSDLYHKQRQFLSLCDSMWPVGVKSQKHVNNFLIEEVVSANSELRSLALQGACMSLYIMGEVEEKEICVIQKLEEMYQLLLGRLEHEKTILEAKLKIQEDVYALPNSAACCVFYPEVLCRNAGCDSLQETLPLIDSTSFFLDMVILKELAVISLVDPNDLQLAMSGVAEVLQLALKYSLKYSSRSPINFMPHQKILWTLDAWTSVDAVNAKMASFVLEMWFRWHCSLWAYCSVSVKCFSMVDRNDIPLPDMFFQPVRTATVVDIMKSASAVKNYHYRSLKLRVASRYLLQSSKQRCHFPTFLLSTARCLFQQIIYAHKKSFDADKFFAIKSIISSSEKEMITQDEIQAVCSLIASSMHEKLASSAKLFIEPLLRELFFESCTDPIYNLGCAWLRIGILRLHLLLTCDDLDPVIKYYFKYSNLKEKISLLDLEIKVRQECNDLVGWPSRRETDKQKAECFENLVTERKRLEQKIVFRANPGKFKKLKHECNEFFNLASSFIKIAANMLSLDLQEITSQICNWQDTATCFINRLSDEYQNYIDIIEPVQVAIYEMKLGLSLVLSNALQRKFLGAVERDNMDLILETIYSFMSFPRDPTSESISVEVNSQLSEFHYYKIRFPKNKWKVDMSLLEKLVCLTRDASDDRMISILQQKAAIHQNILVRVTYSVANARLLDSASFALLDEIYDEFASVWMNMKVQTKTAEDFDTQQYKFRPRIFRIQNIFEVDISTLCDSLANDCFSEWQESLTVDEFSEMDGPSGEHKFMEEEWNVLQDSIWKNMVHMHNRLFGSLNLAVKPETFHVCDADRLFSFVDSYTLGSEMIKGLGGLFSSVLDAKLVPEHLLRLCLEHDQMSSLSHKSTHAYNFYKDSNAPVMANMVKLIVNLQHHVLSLLSNMEDHPGLKKLLDITEMLLSIPLSTPLAKALSGLQFLLGRAWMLQENTPEFYFSEQLEPIIALMYTWQKLEFDSWPALLDEVQDQYNLNAGKLWFPLYSILRHRHSADIAGYNQSTIQRLVHSILFPVLFRCLEEFIQTSSIGEFRIRLALLFAFHGQIKSGICLGYYSGTFEMENLKILYNVYGFYVQFLPTILAHIAVNRRNIEMELKDLLKLCSTWEHSKTYLSIENAKKTRQKLRKLIQKYNDLLQQPVMLYLNQEAALNEIRTQNIRSLEHHGNSSGKNEQMLNAALDVIHSRKKYSSMYCSDWKKTVNLALQKLPFGTLEPSFSNICVNNYEEGATIIHQLASHWPCTVYEQEWKAMWKTLKKICRSAMDCCDLWVDGTKSMRKRRVLSRYMKLLESCGLSKHRALYVEDRMQPCQSNHWFLQPSFDELHLLQSQEDGSPICNVIEDSILFPCLTPEAWDSEWKMANQYYFKSMASVQLLRQICLKFHTDFTLEEVNRSLSFLDHLMVIQQGQRVAAYNFASQVGELKRCVSLLENLCPNVAGFDEKAKWSITSHQRATFKCMWQQKQLFDDLCSTLLENSLLLKKVESAHLDTCGIIKDEAKTLLLFIEKFVPVIQKSKEFLDGYLLDRGRNITTGEMCLIPCLVSEEVKHRLIQNFHILREFEDQLYALCGPELNRSSVRDTLLCHLELIIKKGKMMAEEFNLNTNTKLTYPHGQYTDKSYSGIKGEFYGALQRTLELLINAFKKHSSSNYAAALTEESLGKITSWKNTYDSYVANLRLDLICSELPRAINYSRMLLDQSGSENPNLCVQVVGDFKRLHVLLGLLLNFSQSLLHDFLAMNKTVSILTTAIANVFSSLYVKGLGTSMEDQVDDAGNEKCQDAKGTGMGEGSGLNDVSNQIDDEDQLRGTSEKPSEEKDDSTEVPSKNDKGIEMAEDFDADAFDVSEDSEDENDSNSNENEELDSVIGTTGADSEIADEKLWDKYTDEEPKDGSEKYETGPSVRDKDSNSRELRAKEDDAATSDEPGELNSEDWQKRDDDNGSHDLEDDENVEDMQIDKDETCMDPTGLKPEELNQSVEEDTNMHEQDNLDSEDGEILENHDNAQNKNGDDNSLADESSENAGVKEAGEDNEADTSGEGNEEASEMDPMASKEDACEHGTSNLDSGSVPNSESAMQLQSDLQAEDLRNLATKMNWSGSRDTSNDLAPTRSLPSSSVTDVEIMFGDSKNGTLSEDPQKAQLPQPDPSSLPRNQPNPCWNVGDALEEWKEKVNVCTDLQENSMKASEDVIDDSSIEYGYVNEFDKGTAQALGPANPDQVDKNVNDHKPVEDGHSDCKEEHLEMEIEKNNSEDHPIRRCPVILKQKIEKLVLRSEVEMPNGESPPQVQGHNDGDIKKYSDSSVTVKRSNTSDESQQLSELSSSNCEGKAKIIEDLSNDASNEATILWRKFEFHTTRLSQELAEQLRLVMEPTLASKLQGDYKTGKRINMKKVISYIASHYRKDRIWLRRTRPNKRDYQVVLAVDDSRSMSESCCGEVAIEALVTVCRAMSQLEVGNLAVTSFGKKGNVRLLHNFDQPFTGEAGIKMISSLSFKQENTIIDEPMVDLLRYLNNMLDAAVTNARLPSGQNPLQQLVLIIADGRFHEKESLKRCVRDALNKKRMVAFLLLDSPQDSIMELMEASFQDGNIKLSKYMDSFPFPYYIVLRNIEELPRTMADLLRQWFELAQYSRD